MSNKKKIRNWILVLIIGIFLMNKIENPQNLQRNNQSSMNYSDIILENKLMNSKENPKSGLIMEPIYIYGNDWTTCKYVTGNGTYSDPYILENLEIQTGVYNSIVIEDSTVYGIIRNCKIEKSRIGILLNSSANCKVINNTFIRNFKNGIRLERSQNCSFSKNVVWGSDEGNIFVNSTVNCTFLNNEVLQGQCGITLQSSPNCSFTNTTILNFHHDGFNITDSPNSNLINNIIKFVGFGIRLQNSKNCTISKNNASKTLQYACLIINSSFCVVTNNNFSYSECSSGLSILESEYCLILNNSVLYNEEKGIGISNSKNCLISENYIAFNKDYGIYYNNATSIEIYGNLLEYNLLSGIWEYNSGRFYYRNFPNNTFIYCELKASFFFSESSAQSSLLTYHFYWQNATGGKPPFTYKWEFGDAGTSTEENYEWGYSSSGKYIVTLTVTDNDGNQSICSKSMIISSDSVPKILDISHVSIMIKGKEIQFTMNSLWGDAPYTYSWDFGDGSSSNIRNPNHVYNKTGIFEVEVTIFDLVGKSDTYKFKIRVFSKLGIAFLFFVAPVGILSVSSYLYKNSHLITERKLRKKKGKNPYEEVSFLWTEQ